MGVGCAVILFVIRAYNNGYPEGCSFAILFMNVLTPLIGQMDHATHLWRGEAREGEEERGQTGRCEGMKKQISLSCVYQWPFE